MVHRVREISNAQEGIETHAKQLCTGLAPLGCDVEVIVRSPCISGEPRLFGLKVVTHHGLHYDRDKGGGLAQALLRFRQFAGMVDCAA